MIDDDGCWIPREVGDNLPRCKRLLSPLRPKAAIRLWNEESWGWASVPPVAAVAAVDPAASPAGAPEVPGAAPCRSSPSRVDAHCSYGMRTSNCEPTLS